MIRETDLISYLPKYLQEYRELESLFSAENAEFSIVWDAADKVLKNEFIATADEYGISRFEKLLGILPSKEDTLESRRARVQSRWVDFIPYTEKTLRNQLKLICGENNFILNINYSEYSMTVKITVAKKETLEDVKTLLERVVPVNIVYDVYLIATVGTAATIFIGCKQSAKYKKIKRRVMMYGME